MVNDPNKKLNWWEVPGGGNTSVMNTLGTPNPNLPAPILNRVLPLTAIPKPTLNPGVGATDPNTGLPSTPDVPKPTLNPGPFNSAMSQNGGQGSPLIDKLLSDLLGGMGKTGVSPQSSVLPFLGQNAHLIRAMSQQNPDPALNPGQAPAAPTTPPPDQTQATMNPGDLIRMLSSALAPEVLNQAPNGNDATFGPAPNDGLMHALGGMMPTQTQNDGQMHTMEAPAAGATPVTQAPMQNASAFTLDELLKAINGANAQAGGNLPVPESRFGNMEQFMAALRQMQAQMQPLVDARTANTQATFNQSLQDLRGQWAERGLLSSGAAAAQEVQGANQNARDVAELQARAQAESVPLAFEYLTNASAADNTRFGQQLQNRQLDMQKAQDFIKAMVSGTQMQQQKSQFDTQFTEDQYMNRANLAKVLAEMTGKVFNPFGAGAVQTGQGGSPTQNAPGAAGNVNPFSYVDGLQTLAEKQRQMDAAMAAGQATGWFSDPNDPNHQRVRTLAAEQQQLMAALEMAKIMPTISQGLGGTLSGSQHFANMGELLTSLTGRQNLDAWKTSESLANAYSIARMQQDAENARNSAAIAAANSRAAADRAASGGANSARAAAIARAQQLFAAGDDAGARFALMEAGVNPDNLPQAQQGWNPDIAAYATDKGMSYEAAAVAKRILDLPTGAPDKYMTSEQVKNQLDSWKSSGIAKLSDSGWNSLNSWAGTHFNSANSSGKDRNGGYVLPGTGWLGLGGY